MVIFGMGEYVKNIFYNIISIILLAATFVTSTIFTSNISAEARINNFFEPYLDKNSIITGSMGSKFDPDAIGLVKLEKALYNQEISCDSNNLSDLRQCLVYDEYVMDNLTPRLKEGKIVADGSGELMNILISENSDGIGVGDVIEIEFYDSEGVMDGRRTSVSAKVTGIIESGQKLFLGNGVRISKDMSLRDVIGTYSYEQLEYSTIIIPEKEMEKIPEEILIEVFRCVLKFEDSITTEERQENYRKLIDYEAEHGIGSLIEVFPQMATFVQIHEEETMDIILTNAPLCGAIVVLVIVCIICMISIRNARSMKYYATLYICGMPIRNAVWLSGVEMVVNCILAIILGVSVVKIQMTNEIFGEINCMLNVEQWAIIIAISLVMVISATLTTLKTLKERSPMSVLRDTAY